MLGRWSEVWSDWVNDGWIYLCVWIYDDVWICVWMYGKVCMEKYWIQKWMYTWRMNDAVMYEFDRIVAQNEWGKRRS